MDPNSFPYIYHLLNFMIHLNLNVSKCTDEDKGEGDDED